MCVRIIKCSFVSQLSSRYRCLGQSIMSYSVLCFLLRLVAQLYFACARLPLRSVLRSLNHERETKDANEVESVLDTTASFQPRKDKWGKSLSHKALSANRMAGRSSVGSLTSLTWGIAILGIKVRLQDHRGHWANAICSIYYIEFCI